MAFGWQPSAKLFANIFTLNLIPDFIPVHLEHSANKKLLLWVWLLAHHEASQSFPVVFMRVGLKKFLLFMEQTSLLCGWGRKKTVNFWIWGRDGRCTILPVGILFEWKIFVGSCNKNIQKEGFSVSVILIATGVIFKKFILKSFNDNGNWTKNCRRINHCIKKTFKKLNLERKRHGHWIHKKEDSDFLTLMLKKYFFPKSQLSGSKKWFSLLSKVSGEPRQVRSINYLSFLG